MHQGQEVYRKIVEERRTDFTDAEAEQAVLFCIQDYRAAPNSNIHVDFAVVSATSVQDWSGMIRNMLAALRDKATAVESGGA